jgi:septal ring factor EnvC (AmiA/AmiB activator)
MSDITLEAPTDVRITNGPPATFTVTDQTATIKAARPDPHSWLKEAEADIAKAKRDLEKDLAKIAELEARCSEHRVDIKVHEARADGARRGIAALEPRQSRKAAK